MAGEYCLRASANSIVLGSGMEKHGSQAANVPARKQLFGALKTYRLGLAIGLAIAGAAVLAQQAIGIDDLAIDWSPTASGTTTDASGS